MRQLAGEIIGLAGPKDPRRPSNGELDPAPDELRTEMTGHARVDTGRRTIGAILLNQVLRFVRTEFWW